MTKARIALYYEHPEWFKPLAAELERQGAEVIHLNGAKHRFDPLDDRPPFDLLVNRMSPSSYTRGHGNGLFYTLAFLDYVESRDIPVVNGSAAYRTELSKAAQLNLMARLGVAHPRARVVNHPQQAVAASRGLTFPVVTKANIGGSGAGITLFESEEALAEAAQAGAIDMGVDQTCLVQEFLTPADGYIVRVEFLDGAYLYAIQVESNPAAGFNLCPADVCEIPVEAAAPEGANGARPAAADGRAVAVGFDGEFCPVDAPAKRDVRAYSPPPEIVDTVLRLGRGAQMDIGGIEYLVSDRDGKAYFYDINALSNFVADAPNKVGFDPFQRFAAYLLDRARA